MNFGQQKDMVFFINSCFHSVDNRVLTPPPLSLGAAKAGGNHLNKYTIPPCSPLGLESNIAKPYLSNVLQRPCTDVNSPYKRNAKLNQWALYINNFSEA